MGTGARGSIWKGKEFVNLIKCTGPLWSHKTTCFGLWRFSVWIGSCFVTSTGVRWATDCFCFPFLSSSRKNYSQIDKETLAIVFGVKHFHEYLFRRKFTIKSYHKPLQHLFGEKKGIPAMASARVQWWALLTLSAYDYKVQYVPEKENANADVFSHLPLLVQPKEVPTPEELVLLLESLEISTVTVTQI